jgi:hypothetical protein
VPPFSVIVTYWLVFIHSVGHSLYFCFRPMRSWWVAAVGCYNDSCMLPVGNNKLVGWNNKAQVPGTAAVVDIGTDIDIDVVVEAVVAAGTAAGIVVGAVAGTVVVGAIGI